MAIGTAMSDESPIYYGVPQVSLFGPILSCMYTNPLEDIVFHHGLQYVMYADDIQLHITCNGDQVLICTIEECVSEIRNWMKTNMLAMNDRKA